MYSCVLIWYKLMMQNRLKLSYLRELEDVQ
jgi:hypothetical protein